MTNTIKKCLLIFAGIACLYTAQASAAQERKVTLPAFTKALEDAQLNRTINDPKTLERLQSMITRATNTDVADTMRGKLLRGLGYGNISQLFEEKQNSENRLAEIRAKTEELNKKNEDLKTTGNTKNKTIQDLENQIADLEKQLTDAETTSEDEDAAQKILQGELDKKQGDLYKAQQDLADLRQAMQEQEAKFDKEKQQLKEDKEQLHNRIIGLENHNKDQLNEIKKQAEKIQDLLTQLKNANKNNQQLAKNNATYRDRIRELEDENNNLKKANEDLTNTNKGLNDAINQLNDINKKLTANIQRNTSKPLPKIPVKTETAETQTELEGGLLQQIADLKAQLDARDKEITRLGKETVVPQPEPDVEGGELSNNVRNILTLLLKAVNIEIESDTTSQILLNLASDETNYNNIVQFIKKSGKQEANLQKFAQLLSQKYSFESFKSNLKELMHQINLMRIYILGGKIDDVNITGLETQLREYQHANQLPQQLSSAIDMTKKTAANAVGSIGIIIEKITGKAAQEEIRTRVAGQQPGQVRQGSTPKVKTQKR